jgi:DNA-binding IclR family transcriptional regulator
MHHCEYLAAIGCLTSWEDLFMATTGNHDAEPSGGSQGIQSVELAMNVLRAIEEARAARSLTQIAAAAGMTPSKAHRYLASLGRIGLVAQSQRSGLYDLGPGMRRLGIEAMRRMDEVAQASEYLPGLRDRTSQAVNLAVWGDHGPVIVRWDYGAYPLPITVRVGATMPLLYSSVGRVFLAYLPDATTRPVLREQLAVDDQEAPTERAIQRIVAEVRERGYALTSGGVIPGVTSIAAPVVGSGETLAISIAMPARSATVETLAAVTAELLATTAAIDADNGTEHVLP